MGRAPCCDKANVKKGPWSPEEDIKLKEFIDKYGTCGNWIALPHKAGLRRCGKSCRLRWLNYLRPNIKHGEFSDDEDRIICSLFATIGSRWSIIAAQLPGRTDNDIKNYWNTKLKKKLLGIPPSQRKPHQQHHHQLIPSPSSSLTGLEPFPTTHHDTFTTIPTPMNPPVIIQGVPTHQYQMKNSGYSLLMFGGDQQSCSSSDGSCTQISYGGGEEMMGFETTYLYGGTGTEMLLPGGEKRGDGLWGGSGSLPLEYGYEEIKQLLISSNSLYLDDTTANTVTRGNSNSNSRIMYQSEC